MEVIELPVRIRDLSRKAKDLRRDEGIPAVYYGHGQKNLNLEINYQDFFRVYRKAGESKIIDLRLEGSKKPLKALIYDLQVDPVFDRFVHVDFIHVKMDEAVMTRVPLEFIGESLAVKDLGGILTISRNEVEVKCLPQDLPSKIKVDISSLLDFHSHVRVSDLVLPSGVAVLDDAGSVVVTVSAPKEEIEEEIPAEEEIEEGEKKEGEKALKEEGGEKQRTVEKKEGTE